MTDRTRILLIDDDQVDRASVRRALAGSGIAFELAEAVDGTSGLDAARERTFDCVLLDYRLPDIDAFEILERLLASPAGNHTVIILTGASDPDVAFRLMRAGALDYLAKAELTPSSLARAIRYARARREFLAELEQARRVAEEKTRELQVLNDQKDLLFSIIAHDLRNPFQALLGLSELQLKAVKREDLAAVARYAAGLNQSAALASGLMEGLFAWASLQLTATAVQMAVDIGALVDENALAAVAEAADKKQLSLQNRCGGVVAVADQGTIAAVLRNLVNNAIKFSRAGGSVVITAESTGGHLAVTVADNGIGITPETLAKLFRIDKRTTTPGTEGEAGSGLGLLICRNLVARLGGTLTVETKVGEGTTFRFTLPHPDGIEAARPPIGQATVS